MLNENLSFFLTKEFGTPALINGIEVWGLLDEYYEQSFDLGGDSFGSEGKKYCFKVESSQLLNLNHGDSVETTQPNRLFEIVGVQSCPPDGKLTNLILKKI